MRNRLSRRNGLRFGLLLALAGLMLAVVLGSSALAGGAAASASVPKRVLKFTAIGNSYTATPLGYRGDESAPSPIGSGFIADYALLNQGSQFGRPSGAKIGAAELQCTVASSLRDLCTGVAHLPNGFFAFANAPAHTANPVTWYAVTGGVAGYATARGQIKVTSIPNSSNGKSRVVVTLYG